MIYISGQVHSGAIINNKRAFVVGAILFVYSGFITGYLIYSSVSMTFVLICIVLFRMVLLVVFIGDLYDRCVHDAGSYS